MSVLQDLVCDVTPSQVCHVNMDPILNAYKGMGI